MGSVPTKILPKKQSSKAVVASLPVAPPNNGGAPRAAAVSAPNNSGAPRAAGASAPNNGGAPRAAGANALSNESNKNLDECDVPCVPVLTKRSNRTVKKHCRRSQYNASRCLVEREREKSFYEAIQWDVLIENLPAYMKLFEKKIVSDHTLAEDIQKLYTFGPFPPESERGARRPPNYAEIDIRVVSNRDDFRLCNDIIMKIIVTRGIGAKGKQRQFISHISLHPKLPKYYESSSGRYDGCGYFVRGNADGGEGDSPFQYVIESVDWKSKPFGFADPHRPYQPLFAEPEVPGTFHPITTSQPFPQLDDHPFFESMPKEQKALVRSVHDRIAGHFIQIWNNELQVGFDLVTETERGPVTVAIPKIRRNVGGSRKKRNTRKFKPSRK